jgi:hypothetical protein
MTENIKTNLGYEVAADAVRVRDTLEAVTQRLNHLAAAYDTLGEFYKAEFPQASLVYHMVAEDVDEVLDTLLHAKLFEVVPSADELLVTGTTH